MTRARQTSHSFWYEDRVAGGQASSEQDGNGVALEDVGGPAFEGVNVQVQLGGVPGVADVPHELPGPDRRARLDGHTAVLEMSQEQVDVSTGDDDVIARWIFRVSLFL